LTDVEGNVVSKAAPLVMYEKGKKGERRRGWERRLNLNPKHGIIDEKCASAQSAYDVAAAVS